MRKCASNAKRVSSSNKPVRNSANQRPEIVRRYRNHTDLQTRAGNTERNWTSTLSRTLRLWSRPHWPVGIVLLDETGPVPFLLLLFLRNPHTLKLQLKYVESEEKPSTGGFLTEAATVEKRLNKATGLFIQDTDRLQG